jgi:CheY-like chemotaxis protein/HPt (histidine-containing phosphotransfer) domain-containing protein
VLLNVVGNAIKFTQRGSVRVRVSFEVGSKLLRVDVVDTGIGLSADQLGKLFQPFEQADLSMTRRYGGSGLGLAISRGLVTALGGEIGATSTPGVGSTFTIIVPATPVGPELVHGLSEARRAAELAPMAATRLVGHVLLAEDGPDNQILITTLLRKYGLDVAVAENGALAVEQAQAALRAGRPFGVILMDMQMPVLDGYDATRKLRATGYRAPIVALTAHAMGGERERCIGAGCDDYVRKPIDRAELFETLRRFLGAGSVGASEAPPAPEPPGGALVSAFGDDPDMAEIVDRFVASLPSRVAALRVEHAGGAARRDDVKRLAHQLKGGAGGYGFPAITEAAAALERAVVDGAPDDAVGAALEALAALCDRARARAS